MVEFPVPLGEDIRTLGEVSIWEQASLAALAQEHWADNSVSVTVTFRKDERQYIKEILNLFQFKLKSVSFLPKLEDDTPYKQMPYEEITEKQYLKMIEFIKPLDFSTMLSVDSQSEMYCNNDVCVF